jgi:hypothetical protein
MAAHTLPVLAHPDFPQTYIAMIDHLVDIVAGVLAVSRG